MSFQAKESLVLGRQLKVQRLVIPFVITGHATAASKAIVTDEPSILFIATEGLSHITVAKGAIDSGETVPTFDLTADDSDGKINLLVKVGEAISKVVQAQVINRVDGTLEPAYVDATATSENGDKIRINCDSDVDLSAGNMDACLIVEYIVSE